jgi:hypothetical protein
MFSATLAKEVRATCKKFMQSVRPFSSSLLHSFPPSPSPPLSFLITTVDH